MNTYTVKAMRPAFVICLRFLPETLLTFSAFWPKNYLKLNLLTENELLLLLSVST